MPRRAVAMPLSLLPLSLRAAEEAAAKAPARLAELPMDGGGLASMALGLLLVLMLIGGLAWLLRRLGHLPMANKGAVRVLGGVSLGPRERAVLLGVGQTRLLVGVAPGRVQTLYVLAPDEGLEPVTERFEQRLETAMQERQS